MKCRRAVDLQYKGRVKQYITQRFDEIRYKYSVFLWVAEHAQLTTIWETEARPPWPAASYPGVSLSKKSLFTWSIIVAREKRRGWWEDCTWNARRLAVLGTSISCNKVRLLASCDITIFCYLFLLYWPMLIFFRHLGVNSCCYSWCIWHMPYLKSWNINMSTTAALKN
jgi:hypothetical protein